MSRYAKAIIAAVVAALVVLKSALTGDPAIITPNEWVDIALAFLGAVGVYAWPNTPPAGEPSDPRISERG